MFAKLLSGVMFAALLPGACDPFYNPQTGSLQDPAGAFTYASEDTAKFAGLVSYKDPDPPGDPPVDPPPDDPPPDYPPGGGQDPQ